MTKNKKNLAVGELMRKNAYIMKGKQRIYLKISPSAVNEYISRIKMNIETNMPIIAQSTHENKRNTIMVKYKETEKDGLVPVYDDITAHFGRVDSHIVPGEHEYCTKCLKKIERNGK